MDFDQFAAFDAAGTAGLAAAGETRHAYVMDPAVFYPAMVEHIQAAVAAGKLPAELVDPKPSVDVDPALAARSYVRKARAIRPGAWADALTPRSAFTGEDAADRLFYRAEALELCRLWFTRALKNAKGPLYVRIREDPDYRL